MISPDRLARLPHPFPRVEAVASLLKACRRERGLSLPDLATALHGGAPQSLELLRRVEAGHFPFLSATMIEELRIALRWDPGAVFLAQCQDFAELDKPDPRLWIQIDFTGRSGWAMHAEAECLSTEAPDYAIWFAEGIYSSRRTEYRRLLGKEASITGWVTWSRLRTYRLVAPGEPALGYRPPGWRGATDQDEAWMRRWEEAAGSWAPAEESRDAAASERG